MRFYWQILQAKVVSIVRAAHEWGARLKGPAREHGLPFAVSALLGLCVGLSGTFLSLSLFATAPATPPALPAEAPAIESRTTEPEQLPSPEEAYSTAYDSEDAEPESTALEDVQEFPEEPADPPAGIEDTPLLGGAADPALEAALSGRRHPEPQPRQKAAPAAEEETEPAVDPNLEALLAGRPPRRPEASAQAQPPPSSVASPAPAADDRMPVMDPVLEAVLHQGPGEKR